VNYVGYGSRMQLVEAYRTSHLLVVPSRFEEFSIVILEAQAAGTPVVASNISGPAEIILNNKSGILVD
jgi:glycosyltransferase involved in cell wall biosynthesis